MGVGDPCGGVGLREDVAAGCWGGDALHQASLDEKPEKVEGTLLGDAQRIPDFARRGGELRLIAHRVKIAVGQV
jgi:hypothetical protein